MISRLIGLFLLCAAALRGEVVEQCGKGFLEKREGQLVLHVKGTPYEMGYQHGVLLKKLIQKNVATFLKRGAESTRFPSFLQAVPVMLGHLSENFHEELRGLAEGAELPVEKIATVNLFPELFHCSALIVAGEATKGGDLYHVRVLDYAMGKGLQHSAVVIVAEPERGYPFLNVTYAGFIGSVTGMNKEKIAVGEIGAQGYGSWNGVPMPFIVRTILEKAATLEEAAAILLHSPRTCEYFYAISDGKRGKAFGCYTTALEAQFVEPGSLYGVQLTPNEEGILSFFSQNVPPSASLFFPQPKDCLLFTGPFDRFPIVLSRIQENYGRLDEKELQHIIKGRAGRTSNLHNAIFLPKELKVWISHAGAGGEPAYDRPYSLFSFTELLSGR